MTISKVKLVLGTLKSRKMIEKREHVDKDISITLTMLIFSSSSAGPSYP